MRYDTLQINHYSFSQYYFINGDIYADHHHKIKILYMGGRDHDWKGFTIQ